MMNEQNKGALQHPVQPLEKDSAGEPGNPAMTFEQAWAQKESEGYQYGADALENVRFGWDIAMECQQPEPGSDYGEAIRKAVAAEYEPILAKLQREHDSALDERNVARQELEAALNRLCKSDSSGIVPAPRFVPDQNFKGDTDQATYAAGWNDCRSDMLVRLAALVPLKDVFAITKTDAPLVAYFKQLIDRQKRTEPSGHAYRYSDHEGGTVIRFNDGTEVNGSRPIESVPYWFAPPPAEPVKVPSDEDILEIAKNPISCPCSPWWLKDGVKIGDVRQAAIMFAHALLARYGQPAQPAASAEPVKVPSSIRGEIARKLQERNRHLEVSTARYYVDAVCDLLASHGAAQPLRWPEYTCIHITKLNMGDRWDATCEGFGTVPGCNMIFPRRTPQEALAAILVEMGLAQSAEPVEVVSDEQACRCAYDDFYHKIGAEIRYDHWSAIWRFIKKRLPVAMQRDSTLPETDYEIAQRIFRKPSTVALPDGTARHNVGSDNLSDEDRAEMERQPTEQARCSAHRRLRGYLSKAAFASGTDRHAALECLEELATFQAAAPAEPVAKSAELLGAFFTALDAALALDKTQSAWSVKPTGSFTARSAAWKEVWRLRELLKAQQKGGE